MPEGENDAAVRRVGSERSDNPPSPPTAVACCANPPYALWRAFLLFVTLLLCAPAAHAGATIRAHLSPTGEVAPGTPVKLVVDVLTDEFFTGAPVFPGLAVPGAIVAPVSDDSSHLNETINGKPWFGISRSYLITPQTGGELAIPALEITAKVGAGAAAVKLRTAPLTLHVKVVQRPAGAENAVGTTQLTLKQSLDRKLDGLKQGDSFTRRIEIDVDGVQAMLLPAPDFPPVKGLAIYPVAPVVEDIKGERGVFIGGRRVDAITYVAQQPGDYSLPAFSMQWWDTRANQLRTAQVPALHFSVAANPGYKPAFDIAAEQSQPKAARHVRINLRRVLEVGALVVVAGFLAWWLLPPLLRASKSLQGRLAQRRAQRAQSEQAYFDKLQHADSTQRVSAFYQWLDRLPGERKPASLEEVVQRAGDVQLGGQARDWLAGYYGKSHDRSADGKGAARPVPAWASALRKTASAGRRRNKASLAPLNP
ncbi:BatD family protein [Uliginosibacterium sp. H3]|uniref:BatD family protein n=1 Tax=Uliginosibacterium silvisoli TaxID=3114758 RepID=A0ABU6K176_9RHOO|nr:BatD family protein [Uliginosibacterium sp. H3]